MKRKAHRERLLDLLSDGQKHSMTECMAAGGMRYGGRLFELRGMGHDIETLRIAQDVYAYRLNIRERQMELA